MEAAMPADQPFQLLIDRHGRSTFTSARR